jgi:hypothetical protein
MTKRAKAPEWGGAREGAGRPANENGPGVRVSVWIPSEILARVDAKAGAIGHSRSGATVEALLRWLRSSRP